MKRESTVAPVRPAILNHVPRGSHVSVGMVSRLTDDDLGPALLWIVFVGLALCMQPQNDTFWHLRLGGEMVQEGSIIWTERLSHTAVGAPLFHNHEWLTQLLFYALFAIGGPILLTVACAMSVVGAAQGAWRLVVGSAEIRFIALAALLVVAISGWAIRPQALSASLFVLALYLATSDRDRWLPLLCVFWANLHAVAVTGVIIAGCATLDSLVVARDRLRRSSLILVACAIAPCLSPLGPHYWPRVVEVVRTVKGLGIDEYQPAFQISSLPFWLCVAMLLYLVVAARPAWATTPRRTRVLVLVACAFAVAAATSIRNIPLFVLVAVPAISRLLPQSQTSVRRPGLPTPAMLIVSVVGIAVTGGVVLAWSDHGARLGWKPLSQEAIQAVRTCKGNLFNGFADGGPLAWFVPDRPVLVDSRGIEAYPLSLLLQSRAADLQGEYHDLFEEFDIGCAVVGSDSAMAHALVKEPRMRSTYTDNQWRVFERKD